MISLDCGLLQAFKVSPVPVAKLIPSGRSWRWNDNFFRVLVLVVGSIDFLQTLLVADNVGNEFGYLIGICEVVLDEHVEQELVVSQDLLQFFPRDDLAPLQVGETEDEPNQAEFRGDSEQGLEDNLDERGHQEEAEYEVEDEVHFLVEEVVVESAQSGDILHFSSGAVKSGEIASGGDWEL